MNRNIEDYIKPGARAHLVGVGGVSMAPLAEVLKGKGVEITGSDMRESGTVERLRGLGIPVIIGHLPGSVEGAGCVIRTAAVHDDNPEIAAALRAGIPVFERAQAWGAIMGHYKNALCVAGTHGKTTTTSMCTHIFLAAGRDPSVMIGGTLPILGAGHRVGHGDTIIAESCEYCNSFLSFAPTVAVILNVEADHLDFFKDLEDIKASFRKFAELVPSTGSVIVNNDNAGARSVPPKTSPGSGGCPPLTLWSMERSTPVCPCGWVESITSPTPWLPPPPPMCWGCPGPRWRRDWPPLPGRAGGLRRRGPTTGPMSTTTTPTTPTSCGLCSPWPGPWATSG